MNSHPTRRRECLAITIEILNASINGIIKTHLLYSVGMSYEQLIRYLGFLKKSGFIETQGNLYRTTEKGMKLIAEFESSPLTRSVLLT
jgi:predicted transcriptional regulator